MYSIYLFIRRRRIFFRNIYLFTQIFIILLNVFIYLLAVGDEKYKVSIYLLNVFVGFERMFFPVRKQKKKSQSNKCKILKWKYFRTSRSTQEYLSTQTCQVQNTREYLSTQTWEVQNTQEYLYTQKCQVMPSAKYSRVFIYSNFEISEYSPVSIYSKILVTKYSIPTHLEYFFEYKQGLVHSYIPSYLLQLTFVVLISYLRT